MAEGIMFNMIEKLIWKLGSMIVESWNMRDDLEKLMENMSEIKVVILDAEEQQGANNHQVQLWLEKLKDALEDANDLLDDFHAEDLRRQMMTDDKKAKKFRIFFSSSNQVLFSFKMTQKIKELCKTIKNLNVDMKVFNFTNRAPEQQVFRQRETHSFVREDEVIGRDGEKKELMELIFDTNSKENVSIISIIGVGGLGKTTLSQFVYNDKQVQQHFELKKWVCVSDNFDIKAIAAKILEAKTDVGLDAVQLNLRKEVKGKRYLLVLDDVWNDDRDLWLQLITLLKDGAKGSKIVITTRNEKVATISGTSKCVILKDLDEEQYWRLFCKLAFENGKEPENMELGLIAREIVKRCSGVPLAIRSIGSLMYSMPTENWSTFKNRNFMKIDELGGNKILQIIKLSYDHLPTHLKKCFAFCSLFPKHYSIEKTPLIRLWIAHGFVHSSDECAILEDIGDKYFMELVYRSFFQSIEEQYFFGENKLYFKMHDIVHDVATSVSINDNILVNEKKEHIRKQIRHVSFDFELVSSWKVPTSLLTASKLRTFLLPPYRNIMAYPIQVSTCNSILSSFRRLHVLYLTKIISTKIPSCLGRMKHLRYLNLSNNNKVEELPKSITELIHLETLLLNYCSELKKLPKDLWKLVSLRHLELHGCNCLTFMPRGIGKLSNLQTLTQFVLDITSKDKAKANEIGGLNNLRGELMIKGLECLRHCPTEVKDMNLMQKSHLHKLKLMWKNEENDTDANDLEKDDIILHDIVQHSNIEVLLISGFGGMTLASLVNSYTIFTKLVLTSCKRLQYLKLSSFHVKHLHIYNLPRLEWIVEDNNSNENSLTSCSSLTKIELLQLYGLKGWCSCSNKEMLKGCSHQLKSLEYLRIYSCENLISIPQHTTIKKKNIYSVTEMLFQQAVNYSKVEILNLGHIINFKSLRTIIHHLTEVREFSISICKEFDPCNDEGGCYSMQWKELTNLKVLMFDKIPKMKYLPEGLKHVTTLQTLRIQCCKNLTTIPKWAKSLQALVVQECPNFTST